jgi:aconitate hydratase 2/2-methylisocitrate dehydratase
MGNQARVPDGVNVFSTSTRNFDDRIGNGAKVFLGSAELGAVSALMGKLPTPAEFLKVYAEKIEPKKDCVYQYLQFDEMAGYK